MTSTNWHIIAAQYPPFHGGVSDYTGLVAEDLAKHGQSVNVWTSQREGEHEVSPGAEKSRNFPIVHRVVPSWKSPKDLQRLSSLLNEFPGPRTLLIQHTPQIWGSAGVNLRFPSWVESRSRAGDRIVLMVHEAAYPFSLFDRPTRWPLHAIHVHILRKLLKSSDQVYVSCEAFQKFIQRYDPRPDRLCSLLPVPSNIPFENNQQAVAELRTKLVPSSEMLIGSFAQFGHLMPQEFYEIVARLLSGSKDRHFLLIGPRGDAVAEKIAQQYPLLRDRLITTGRLEASSLSIHLQACDLMIQLYGDGPSTRRGTLMACASHGKAIITGDGHLADRMWANERCVFLCPNNKVEEIVNAAEIVLADSDLRKNLESRAKQVYDRRLALDHTIQTLISDAS